jgi:hypothetical protein
MARPQRKVKYVLLFRDQNAGGGGGLFSLCTSPALYLLIPFFLAEIKEFCMYFAVGLVSLLSILS